MPHLGIDIERIRAATGFRFQVISGDEEARLTFLGALLPGMAPERSAVIDTSLLRPAQLRALAKGPLPIAPVVLPEPPPAKKK